MGKKILYQHIYDSLLAEIQNGQLPAGTRLPSEQEIAESFGVSKITSKKALDLLCESGFIYKRPGVGSFVGEKKEKKPPLDQPQRSQIIGFINNAFSEVSGNELLHKLHAYAQKSGYQLITMLTLDSQEAETREIQLLKSIHAQGLIIAPVFAGSYSNEFVKSIINEFPMVCVDVVMQELQSCVVTHDSRQAMHDMVNFLVKRGHRKIGYLSSEPNATKGLSESYEAFIEAMCMNRIIDFYPYIFTQEEHVANYIFYDEESMEKDRAALRDYLDRFPELTAVIAVDYRIACVCREVLEERGKSCPRDLSIICYYEQKRFSSPIFFHHISVDEDALAAECIRQLIHQIEDKNAPKQRINVAYSLVEGSSVRDLTAEVE